MGVISIVPQNCASTNLWAVGNELKNRSKLFASPAGLTMIYVASVFVPFKMCTQSRTRLGARCFREHGVVGRHTR